MQDLNEIACFVRVVQHRSITGAAAAMGLPKSTVSRRLAALEKRLQVTLLTRTTRRINLTEAGEHYFSKMAKAIAEMDQVEEELQSEQQHIHGTIRVTAPVEFGYGCFMDAIHEFQETYPEVVIELLLTERVVDLIGESVDLALRIGQLKDSTMISRKIGTITGHLVASPRYLKERGEPTKLDDLYKHRLLAFMPNGFSLQWTLRHAQTRRTIKLSSRLASNNVLALKNAALNHRGIAIMPTFMIEDELAARALRIVLPSWIEYGSPISLVFPGQRYVAPKTRALIAHLTQRLRFGEHRAER